MSAAVLQLKAQPLTLEAFAAFGEVIDSRRSEHFMINSGRTRRHHDLAKVEVAGESPRVLISIFVSQPVTVPLELTFLERHPLGSQAFMPLHEEQFLIVVAPPGDAIDPTEVRAFITDGRQGVNYHRGTWHMPLISFAEGSEYLVIDRGGSEHNCEQHSFAEAILLGDV